jgi:hypothetical protein
LKKQNKMESTIIKLGGEPTSGSNMVVQSATFEEAFGDYSNAKGRGRARKKKRKLERITNRQEVKQARKGGRQEARISRRSNRKALRQEGRDAQQDSRLGRRQSRIDARGERGMSKEMGRQERDNYAVEQELYRDSLYPQETTQDQGYAPEQGGGYDEPQGGGYYDESPAPAPSYGGGYDESPAPSYGGYYDESPAPAPSYGGGNEYAYQEEDTYESEYAPEEGAYGDDNSYEGEYIQEEDEFGDDSYFNVEGMDGKAVVSPYVKDTIQKIKNNTSAYKALAQKRQFAERNGDHTRGLDNIMSRTRARIVELKSSLDGYCNADGNPTEMKRRRREINLALGRRLKPRNLRNQYAGSETPVESDLNPEFGDNRIEIPSQSGFDAYSQEGRPVIINGKEDNNIPTYGNDIDGDFEPTTIEMSSSFDGASGNKKVLISVAVGIGVGVLALYLAKRKGLI